VISPLLANVYLHYVLDVWFAEVVKPRLKGRAFLVRYADDFVMGFASEEDARRVLDVLPKRFGKYGLTLHPDKTRLLPFGRPGHAPESSGGPKEPPGSFDFLGFTHFWSRSKQDRWVVKRKTAGSRFHRAVRTVAQWCRLNRHLPIGEQYRALSRKLQGHYAYYGAMIGNRRCCQRFRYEVMRLWQKWLSRRHRRGRWTWERLNRLLKVLGLPWPRGWVPPCVVKL
jgi:hypothetical protein